MSELALPYLQGYWERSLGVPGAAIGAPDLDHTLLCGLGLNLLETLRFLHGERPSFAEFEAWIRTTNEGLDVGRLRRALAGETVEAEVSLEGVEGLTAEELAHWDEHGYVVLRGAVSVEQAGAAEAAIYEYLGMDPQDAASWYGNPEGHTIWVRLLRHPAFQATRRSPRMVKAFAQLWGREDLWVTVDQGGLNPPEREGWRFPGPFTHWDTSLKDAENFGVQGILYLADCAADQGAFTCVPGFHKRLKGWLAVLGEGVDPRVAVLEEAGLVPIPAGAGDMVIWNHLLPHGSSANRSVRPRVAQYIAMKPTRWDCAEEWL